MPTPRLLPTIFPASSVIGLTWIRIGAFAAQRNEIVLRISGPRPPSANPFGSATRLHSEPSDLALNDAEARTLLSPLVTTTRRFGSNEIEKLDVEQATVPVPTLALLPKPRRRQRSVGAFDPSVALPVRRASDVRQAVRQRRRPPRAPPARGPRARPQTRVARRRAQPRRSGPRA